MPFVLRFKDNSPFTPSTDTLNADALRRTWNVCTKVASSLEKGSRLENLSWRLWHMERRTEDSKRSGIEMQASLGQEDLLLDRLNQPMQAPQPRHAYNPAPALDWPPIADDSWNTLFGSNAPPPPLPPPVLPPPTNNNAMFNAFSSTGQPSSYALSPQMQAMYPILPAFHSSYGSYNVVQGPYSRFLTPSPEPSLMGSLGMDEMNDGFRDAERGGEVTFESIWRDFEERGGRERTTDPFEGLIIAGRSGGTSPRPEQGRPVFDIEGDEMARLERRLEGGERYEQRTVADCPPQPPTLALPQNSYDQQPAYDPRSLQYRYPLAYPGSFDAGQPAQQQPSVYDSPHFRPQHPSSNESSPYDSVDPSRGALDWSAQATHLESAPAEAGPSNGGDAGPATKAVKRKRKPKEKAAPAAGAAAAHKKNRNPHATQVPGTGSRKEPKVEASDDHEGPSCSHCASIVTPLWRRGPADELLCNACGLYLKLHGKPRPKGFSKQAIGARGRTTTGAAAQAAASATPPTCHNCAATSTPMWRKDAEGKLLCNACCLYHKLHNIPRPTSLSHKRKATDSAPPSRRPSVDASVPPPPLADLTLPPAPLPQPSPPPVPAPTLHFPALPPRPSPEVEWPSPRLPTLPNPSDRFPSPVSRHWRSLAPTESPARSVSPYAAPVSNDREEPHKRLRIDESWERTSPAPVTTGGLGYFGGPPQAQGLTQAYAFGNHPYSEARG